MGVISYDIEITSSIPPAKMFKAFVLDADTLIPKILPQAIKSVEILEGDGGPGTIKLVTFGEGSQYKSVKHKVDGIDKETFTYSYSIIEGDALMGVLESISYEIKIEASADGGSICKNSSKYHTKGDAQITEEQIKSGKEKASGMFKAVEAYLLANPDAC
ncbi:major allergen Pru ar 1-like [Cornus florida]|uniref:major allergen Pru ar 1-like n=1 Tax=Cornus florida TaxID=4283 RepID=UPI00289DF338|nr:major allergen Pru ar 1-like [Cornus florida]